MSTTRNDQQAQRLATSLGLTAAGYNPGDGVKVRIFEGLEKDYHDAHAIFATNGAPGAWAKALNFLEGYKAAKHVRTFDAPGQISVEVKDV